MNDIGMWLRMLGGSALVGIVGWIGFHRPSWVRSTTTRWRWHLGAMSHGLLFVAIFWLLSLLIGHLAGATPGASRTAWSALVATLLVQWLPPLRDRPRDWLRKHVTQAPILAQRLARRLSEAEFRLDPVRVEQARVMLLRRGIDSEADWLPLTQPAHKLLLRAAVLFLQLGEWERERSHRRFLAEACNEFDELRQRFDRLSLRAARSLASIERVGEIRVRFSEISGQSDVPQSQDTDRLLRALVSEMIADLCEDATHFFREASLLCARGVLTTSGSARSRVEALRRMGFDVADEPTNAGYQALAYGLVVILLGLSPWAPHLRSVVFSQWQIFLVIVFAQLGALAFAIVPKLHFGFANAGLTRHTPWSFVAGAGVAAALFMLLVNLSGAWLVGGWVAVATRFVEIRLIALSPLANASCVAWLVQDHRWRQTETEFARRALDGACLGAAWAVASLLIQVLTLTLDGHLMYRLAMALGTLVYSFCFGGAIGMIVPHLVRTDARQGPYAAAAGLKLPPAWRLAPAATMRSVATAD